MPSKYTRLNSCRGFTVVELMIALSVLSVILVTASLIMTHIGNLYTKGLNAASLQNATRNVSTDITSSIQFSGKEPACDSATNPKVCYNDMMDYPGDTAYKIYSLCIGTTRYSFVLDRESGEDHGKSPVATTPHVLWRDTMTTDSPCKPLNLSVAGTPGGTTDPDNPSLGGYEMVPDHMRLTRFKVEKNPVIGIYQVDVWTAYGDSDLLNTDPTDGRTTCIGGAGSQFCAMADISTKVKLRVE